MTRSTGRTAIYISIAAAVIALFAMLTIRNSKSERSDEKRGPKVTEQTAEKKIDVPPDPNDPFGWLEDSSSPRAQTWLKGQATRAEVYFEKQPVRETLREEFRSLYSMDTVGMPHPYHKKYFSWNRRGDQDLSVLYVRDSLNGEPRLLLDQNDLSPNHTTRVVSWAPSRNAKLMAYGLTASGNDRHDLRVMNVTTGHSLPDLIPDEFYPSFDSWDLRGTGFWYTKHDPAAPMSEAKLHHRLYYHHLGTTWQDDELVFGATGFDKESSFSASLSDDGRHLLVSAYGQDKATDQEWMETYIRDRHDPGGEFVCIVPRKLNVGQGISLHRGRAYLVTDEAAPNSKILALPIRRLMRGDRNWQTVIPEGPTPLESMKFVGHRLFIETLENVHSVLREYDLNGNLVQKVSLPALGHLGGITALRENAKEMFFSFSSFALPPTTYRIDLKTGQRTVLHQAIAGFDTKETETSQVWFTSKDGTRVPMFVIHKRGLKLDGDNPTVLYGYGGFNISLTPGFMKSIVPFVKRGGVYAIANLRGGGEFGKSWHEAGMKKNKQNVFDDFEAAARWLIANGYTRSERLAVEGGSNGGLLTLVTATQHPHLVKAVISAVPVADMLRFHLFFGGIYWIPDYGNPDDPDMRKYLRGYSPYHNVVDGEHYPAILITTSDGDDRVHPMHSYKMAARLQEANVSDSPILLRVELKAGHGGAGAISKYVEQAADEWCFIFDQLGVTD